MKHLGDIACPNGAEIEEFPLAVLRARFGEE